MPFCHSERHGQFVFLKISLRVWSEDLVNSVKIDGDGEASDFENDDVKNDFIFSNDKNINSELSAPGLLQRVLETA